MSSLIVKQENSGQRLDVFLSERFCDTSRSQWQKRIKAGEVLVNGKAVSAGYRLKVGDKVKFSIFNFQFSNNNKILELTSKKEKADIKNLKNIKIVFEGDNYAVVNKPAGVVVHPDNKHKTDTLVDWLLEKYPQIKGVGERAERPGIVHRLDKGVSGLMVVALNQEMFEHLKREFKERRVEKTYLALVYGIMEKDEGEIKTPIRRAKSKGLFVADGTFGSEARRAVTRYEVIQRYKRYSLLRIKILTGRTHQIRVHLSSIGHGIVGDELYVTHDVKTKRKRVELGRLWLHAFSLSFNDLDWRRQSFKAEPPSELKSFLEHLK